MNPRINPERPKNRSDYTYDYDRTQYMADYYAARREELNNLAKKRYRKKNKKLKKQAREKYIPKTKRHSIYR